MSRERVDYRSTLEDILQFTGGARLLSLAQVQKYTGVRDNRTLKRMFPFDGRYISAVALARAMCKGEEERR